MTTRQISEVTVRRALMWDGFLALLWLGIAILRPETTFHLAPFLVASAPTVLYSLDERSVRDRGSVMTLGMIGAALALGTGLAVSAVGAMEGPAFEPFGSPAAEALVSTAVGTVVGIGFGWMRSG